MLGQKPMQRGLRYLDIKALRCVCPEMASVRTLNLNPLKINSIGKKLLHLFGSFTSFDMQCLEKLSFFWFGEEGSRVLAHASDRQAKSVPASCCQ